MVGALQFCYRISTRRACEVLRFERSSFYYRSRKNLQTELQMRIRELAASRVRYGYRRLHVLLLREGWQINHKRVYRLYKEEGLSLRLKSKKKRVSQPRVPMPAAIAPNEIWSMDFMADRLASGRQLRLLTLVDNFSRESPAIEVDFSLNGNRVVEVLERLKWSRGLPKRSKLITVRNLFPKWLISGHIETKLDWIFLDRASLSIMRLLKVLTAESDRNV